MKKLTALLVLAAIFTVAAILAAQPTFSRGNYRISFIGSNPEYATDADTIPTKVVFTANFVRRVVNDADATDSEWSQKQLTTSFDLLKNPATVTSAAGATVTDAQLAALLRQRIRTAAGLP